MKQTLALRMGQSLTMTPALQQAIRMLQLSTLDLRMEIQQAVDSNLMLEHIEDDPGPSIDEIALHADGGTDPPATDTDTGVITDPPDEDWSGDYDSPGQRDARTESELYDYRQASLHESASLQDHLLWQAGLSRFDQDQAEIAAHLIDAVNDDGYLQDWPGLLARLTASTRVSAAQVESVLRAVQDFDPPGVAARSLAECLRLQLQQLDAEPEVCDAALAIVDSHMLALSRHDEPALLRATGLDRETLARALALIQSLQPHPGRPFQNVEAQYVTPDVIVTRRSGRWHVALNPEIAPRIRINRQYLGLIRRADASADQQTMKQHLQEARYFLNSLKSRNDTVLRVAACIVEEQRAFLDYGDEAMRPLVLRDVADHLGIHESTVSRATANKFMLTPRGLYELKYFFSSHVKTTQGGTASATAIQAMIRRLIGQESPDKPLSDARLGELLLTEGVRIARRTVAKYREGLGIPAAHERRRLA